MARAKAKAADSPCDRKQIPASGGKLSKTIPEWMTPEEYQELGYPEYDPKLKDKEYMRQQLQLEMTDPRVNPNLLLSQDDAEFWHNSARKPFNKTLLESEQWWNSRRQTWMKQYDTITDANKKREFIAELLEDCSAETRRLVTPILKYRIVERVLLNLLDQAKEQGLPAEKFKDLVEREETRSTLMNMRNRIDLGGQKAAEDMLTSYNALSDRLVSELADRKMAVDRTQPRIADMQTLGEVLNWSEKCKKDGILEWEKGNFKGAHMSWKLADAGLRRFRAPHYNENENGMRDALHGSILKNLAQVCNKLQLWTEALEAADSAVALDDQDHKAWFRRACSLEGLGRIAEATECLDKIDEIAIGRADRCRINKDTQAKREKYDVIIQRDNDTHQKMAERAIQSEVFSSDRESHVLGIEDDRPTGNVTEQSLSGARRRLTADGAEDLLMDLKSAYSDTTFQKQVFKLSRDMKKNKSEFMRNLGKVALPVQLRVLEKWGFEPSEEGVLEMTRAIQDHTQGKHVDDKLRLQADAVARALYGVMYDVITRPESAGEYVPQLEMRLNGNNENGDVIDVDD